MNVNIRTIENGSIMATGRFRERYFATDEELLSALEAELALARTKHPHDSKGDDDD